MIIGIILAIIFVILAIKFATKRICNKKFDKAILKIHKIIGICMLLVLVAHIFSVWELKRQRPSVMFLSGYIMSVLIIITIASYFFKAKLKKWITIHRLCTFFIFICLILHIFTGVKSLASYNLAISDIKIKDINFSAYDDGVYTGSCDVGYIYVSVNVVINKHKIEEINILEHRNEMGKPAEKIIYDIKKQQSLNVDTISGATNSSNVIKKAIENAFEK
ncbi:FMN-binding protein [uncultured Clostridium sp.]|uniref:FMN-binding protein n=1 Tax=uncultured Clostridium sp. TaxID=59620 RepID=UPI00272B8B13|nr:FMN-binding protein [uncultured Clostridium sp.]